MKYLDRIKSYKIKSWKKLSFAYKFLVIFAILIGTTTAGLYSIAYWYQQKHKHEPMSLGVTFIADYANYLGVDPHKTFLALRDDLGFKRFRLVSFWDNIEKTPGNYDFSELDWEFQQVNAVHGKVSLAIGLRQPRWPECHMPDWASREPTAKWYPQLINYMTAVINRYKNNPALASYQLENEYYLSVFANCPDSTKQRLINEFSLVKRLDNKTPVIISLSNNYLGIPLNQPRPDQYGVSVYKRVWDKTVTHNYFEYPFPSWWYASRAGLTEIFTGKTSMLHELQAEPWPPNGVIGSSQDELSKSMNAKLLSARLKYGEESGFRDIDLWGGEWWYQQLILHNNPSLWNVVKQSVNQVNSNNQKL